MNWVSKEEWFPPIDVEVLCDTRGEYFIASRQKVSVESFSGPQNVLVFVEKQTGKCIWPDYWMPLPNRRRDYED